MTTKTEIDPNLLLIESLKEHGVTASAPATLNEIVEHIRKDGCSDVFHLDDKKKGRDAVRRALKQAVKAGTVSEFDTDPKAYGLITGHEGRARTATVQGTGTWRDGRSAAVVKAAEAWAPDFLSRARADERIELPSMADGELCELLLTRWYAGGKGFNERKLFRDLRTAYPSAMQTEAEAEQPEGDEPEGSESDEGDEPSDEG